MDCNGFRPWLNWFSRLAIVFVSLLIRLPRSILNGLAKLAPTTPSKRPAKSPTSQKHDRSAPWQTRLSRLIKNFGPSQDAASFRSDYQKVLNDAPSEQAELLAPVPELLEKWCSTSPPHPAEAQRQWQVFYESGKDRLPSVILEALLRRFPKGKPGEQHWDRFLLECRKAPLVEALWSAHVVGGQDLNRLARSKPSEFYQSAALDVLVKRGALRDAVTVLTESSAAADRAPGLLRRDQFVAEWYLSARGPKSDEQLSSILLASPQIADSVLALLLDQRPRACQFCQYLMSERRKREKKTSVSRRDRIDLLLVQWLGQCDTELEKPTSPRHMTASLLIGVMLLALMIEPDQARTAEDSNLMMAIRNLAKKVSLLALRAHEEHQPKSAVVAIQSHDLYHTVQEYLANLQAGTSKGDETPERATRYQRYLGRKEAIEQVLQALHSSSADGGIRDTLEAALYNLGVRSLGTIGATASFNFREHESDTPGTTDGESVVIISAGRILGDANDRIVLVRAKVQPQSDFSGSR